MMQKIVDKMTPGILSRSLTGKEQLPRGKGKISIQDFWAAESCREWEQLLHLVVARCFHISNQRLHHVFCISGAEEAH